MEYLAVIRLREGRVDADERLVKEDSGKDDKSQEKGHSPPRTKRKPLKGPILLFVGPPGTGKTSLGQSIARASGRPFQRIALGGAEIRGHRRTYVASGPGLIVQALRTIERRDGVLLL